MLGMLPLLVSSQEQSLGGGTVAIAVGTSGALVRWRPLGGGTVAIATTTAGTVVLRMPGRALATVRPAMLATPTQVP